MNRIHAIVLSIIIIVTLSACGTFFSHNHLKMIEQGHKPRVALVVSIPNTIFIEYVANTVDNNRSYIYSSSTSFKNAIYKRVSEVINRDTIVELYQQQPKENSELFNNLAYEEKFYWKNQELSDQDKRVISGWGKTRNLDFIAFLIPGLLQLSPDHARIIAEKGVIAGPGGDNHRLIKYVIRLFDVQNLNWSALESEETIIHINKAYKRKLSNIEINEIKQKRQIKIDENNSYEIAVPSLEYELELASYYQGDDFASLTEEQLLDIDNKLYPFINKNIEQLLIKTGLAKVKKITKMTEVTKSTVERFND